jgi:hypothetical protein
VRQRRRQFDLILAAKAYVKISLWMADGDLGYQKRSKSLKAFVTA